jgi:small conductance mechanosensitive channel
MPTKETADALATLQETIIKFFVEYGFKLLGAAIIMVAGMLIARWLGNLMMKALNKRDLETPVRMLLVRVVKLLVIALTLVIAVQKLGVEVMPLVAGIGVAGVGVGLAMQGVLSNVVAGLTIIFTKPYRIGESIAIVGVDGTVESITLFSTVLRHADRSRVVVPNRKIVGEILHNYGTMRQCELEVRVGFDADLRHALSAIDELVRAHPKVLDEPAPQIQVAALGSSAVSITARPWVAVADFGSVEGELYVQIIGALRRQGLQIAIPQTDVRLLGAVPQAATS